MDFLTIASGIKATIELAKTVKDIAGEAQIKQKSIELYDSIISLQSNIMSIQTSYHQALQEKHSLEKKLMDIEGWEKEKAKYSLVKIGEGVHVFSLKREHHVTMPPHYICPNCYHEDKQSILQADYVSNNNTQYKCPRCKNSFDTNPVMPQSDSFNIEDEF